MTFLIKDMFNLPKSHDVMIANERVGEIRYGIKGGGILPLFFPKFELQQGFTARALREIANHLDSNINKS